MFRGSEPNDGSLRGWAIDSVEDASRALLWFIPWVIVAAIVATVFDLSYRTATTVLVVVTVVGALLVALWRTVRSSWRGRTPNLARRRDRGDL